MASEHHEQAMLVEWLALKGIGHFSVPNGAHLATRQMAKLKAEGLLPGAPDLVLMRTAGPYSLAPGAREYFRPVAIEMKAADGGAVSDAQKDVHRRLKDEAWIVLVCHGFEDAVKQLEALPLW